MDEHFKPCERVQLSETLLPTETARLFTSDDRKLIYTCLCQSEGIYLTRTLTEFNTSVIAVTKMITYKFLCGVLLRMHGRSADGVFLLSDFSFT